MDWWFSIQIHTTWSYPPGTAAPVHGPPLPAVLPVAAEGDGDADEDDCDGSGGNDVDEDDPAVAAVDGTRDGGGEEEHAPVTTAAARARRDHLVTSRHGAARRTRRNRERPPPLSQDVGVEAVGAVPHRDAGGRVGERDLAAGAVVPERAR
jgi:hypothetical protein